MEKGVPQLSKEDIFSEYCFSFSMAEEILREATHDSEVQWASLPFPFTEEKEEGTTQSSFFVFGFVSFRSLGNYKEDTKKWHFCSVSEKGKGLVLQNAPYFHP